MHRVTSHQAHADELTVDGEHDVKTRMQQDLKREKRGAPPPVGKSPAKGPARQAGYTHAAQHARSYMKTHTRSKGTAGGQQLASPGRGRCCQHPQVFADAG
jgi:hypothetical protein